MNYQNDILGQGFEFLTIHQPDDYEGKVLCTLIRKQSKPGVSRAFLHIHGFNDYFFHTEFAETFVERGFNFYALDLRKYGRSHLPHQKFNNVRDLAEYDEDILAALNVIRSEGNQKIVLSGHSLGGLIALLFASKNQHLSLFDAIFLNSPFFEQNKDIVTKKLLIPLIARLAKKYPNVLVPGGFSKFYGPSLHSSGYGMWDYNLTWKPHVAPLVNMGWIKAVYEGQKIVQHGLSLDKPILVLHPARSIASHRWKDDFKYCDAVVNVGDIDRYARKINGPCTIMSITDAVHDIMLSSKPSRDMAYDTLYGWLLSETNFFK